jgi:hypothetical protein
MMAELPVSAGGDHEMLAVVVPDIRVAIGAAGAPGSAVMVTGFDGSEGGPVPAGLVAVTVKVYVSPGVRPVMIHVLAGEDPTS